jgi:membrane protease YdiL (CAAX protease family)
VRAADAATMVIVYALGGRALLNAGKSAGEGGAQIALALQLALLVLVAVWAAIYLARRPRGIARAGRVRSLLLAAGVGALAGGIVLATRGAHARLPALAVAVAALAVLAEEVVLRGVLQRSVSTSRLGAAAISTAVGVITALLSLSLSAQGAAAAGPIVAVATGHAAAAVAYAFSGRVAAAWLSRVVLVGLAAFASFA